MNTAKKLEFEALHESALDEASLRRLAEEAGDGGEDTLRDVLALYLATGTELVGEGTAAIARNDAAGFRETAKALGMISTQIGALRLSALCNVAGDDATPVTPDIAQSIGEGFEAVRAELRRRFFPGN